MSQPQPQQKPQAPPLQVQPLSPEAQAFVESMGVYFERYTLSRIGGRLLGLLLVADRPLSLDDLANILSVSRASVSTNMRLILATGLAELMTLPGDRHDYYQFTHDTWERALLIDIDATHLLRKLAERGLEAIATSENTAREHLDSMIEFCDLALADRRATLERWRALRQAKREIKK
jgi:DNA-binding transcriptional regulator GbsR (MarR family)